MPEGEGELCDPILRRHERREQNPDVLLGDRSSVRCELPGTTSAQTFSAADLAALVSPEGDSFNLLLHSARTSDALEHGLEVRFTEGSLRESLIFLEGIGE